MAFYEEFSAISSDAQLKQFLNLYGFHEVIADKRWNLGQYELAHDGTTYGVGYRWYDPSQAFSIQRDIHKAELWTIDSAGNQLARGSISFPEGY
jgi:hypothetical protein